MCAAIGLNVRRTGVDSAATLQGLHATWARIVLMRENDLTATLRGYQQHGISTLGVIARESLAGFASTADALAYYVRAYNPYLAAIEAGNEPDGTGDSSWTMSQANLVTLGRLTRAVFPSTRIILGGLVSGHPEWLDGVSLEWCDAIGVHPYLRDAPNPSDTEDLPDVNDLVSQYQRFGKPVWITEWGWWGAEEKRAAEEVDDMIGWAANATEIGGFFYFALGDDVPPFGLLDVSGSEKARAAAFRSQAAHAVPVSWPPLPSPTPTPAPAVSDPWQFFSAEQIANAAQLDLGNVQAYWPKIHAQLILCKIADRATQIAAIGTTAVESGMRPIHEYGTPADWAGYEGGAAYAGRGFIQLTHLSNYRTYSQQINDLWQAGGAIDLVARPEDALDPDVAAAVLALYFKSHGIPALAAAADWLGVRRAVYGGTDQAGAARIGRIAAALGAAAPPTPVPTDPSTPYILALKTLRDSTLPAVEAQVKELRRIVEQYVGSD